MGLSGSLRTLSLAEIFQTLNRSQATGILRLSSVGGGRDVVFDSGEIIHVLHRNENTQHTLIERLAALGLISEELIGQPLGSGSGGYSAVEALVAQGQLEKAQVDQATLEMVQDEVFNLFTWSSANFLFREATEHDPEASEIVAKAQQHPVQTSMGMLLMEAARRQDEWSEISEYLPSENDVPVIIEERQAELAERAVNYPERPVVQLINGVHCFDDIYRLAPVPTMDVQFVIYDLMADGFIQILSIEQMMQRGQEFFAQQQPAQAAQLFRRVLATDPSREDAMGLLANVLELLGNSPDASGCYGQLAITYLRDGRQRDAIHMARRASELDASSSQALVLVRCLVESGQHPEAVSELHKLITKQIDEGQLDEARSTCLKILDIDSGDETARRELARIYQMCGIEGQDDEIVVCVECGETNPRQTEQCVSCGAPLHLTCLSCSRVIAASDAMCIFCGADPHRLARERRTTEAPRTEAIISGSRQLEHDSSDIDTEDWREDLKKQVQVARDLEEKKRFEEALEIWKRVARDQYDNPELDAHVRELEALVHDSEVERYIEAGHKMRDRRRFASARKQYQRALRGMANDDPRAQRIRELIDGATRSHRMASAAYAMALICLAAAFWMVIEPRLIRNAFVEDIGKSNDQLRSHLAAVDPAVYHQIKDVPAGFRSRAKEEGLADDEAVMRLIVEGESIVGMVQAKTSTHALQAIEKLVEDKKWKQARSQLQVYSTQFPPTVLQQRVAKIKERIGDLEKTEKNLQAVLDEAPKRFAEAQKLLNGGDYRIAVKAFEALTDSPHEGVSKDAANQVDRLVGLRTELQSAWDRIQIEAKTDLTAAVKEWEKLGESAQLWGRKEDWRNELSRMKNQLSTAERVFAGFGSDLTIEELESFIKKYPGTPQIAKARQRLEALEKSLADKAERIKALVTRYKKAKAAEDIEDARDAAQSLWRGHPKVAADEAVQVPVVFTGEKPGITVALGNKTLGKLDAQGRFVHWYLGDQEPKAQWTFAAEGFEAKQVPSERIIAQGGWVIALERSAVWEKDLRKPIAMLRMLNKDTMLTLVGTELHGLGLTGDNKWAVNLGAGNALAMAQLVRQQGERIIVPTNANAVAIVDVKGGNQQLVPVTGVVVDTPVIHVSNLQQREHLAVVTSKLFDGPLEGDLKAGAGGLFRGPFVIPGDIDNTLVVANARNELLAFKHGDLAKPVWRQAVAGALDLSPFMPVGPTAFATVTSGDKLVCLEIGEQGFEQRWAHPVRPVDRFVVPAHLDAGRIVYAGKTLARCYDAKDAQGRLLQELKAPKGTTITAAHLDASGGVLGLTLTDGSQQVGYFIDGKLSWTRRLGAPIKAVVLTDKTVVVGLETGKVIGLAR